MVPFRWLTSLALLLTLPSCYSTIVRARPSTAPREWPCPNADDILPCVCTSDELYNLFMDCSLALDENELSNAFLAIFPFPDFLQLTIDQTGSSNKLPSIARYAFQELNFQRIIIKSTNINYIDEETLSMSSSTLKHLDLSNNKLNLFPFETIPNYKVLDTFIIDDNLFTDLPPLASTSLKTLSVSGNRNLVFSSLVFTESPSLTTIRMSRIDLQSLYTQMFETLQDIKFIDLSQNSITELDELAFNPPGNKIDSVALNNNAITSVRHDAIHGLTKNSSLNFMSNGIIDLDGDVWQPIFDEAINGKFDFSDNPLRCGCEIAWMMLNEGYDIYRPLISETTLCNSGEQLISLDVSYFQRCTTTTVTSVDKHP